MSFLSVLSNASKMRKDNSAPVVEADLGRGRVGIPILRKSQYTQLKGRLIKLNIHLTYHHAAVLGSGRPRNAIPFYKGQCQSSLLGESVEEGP